MLIVKSRDKIFFIASTVVHFFIFGALWFGQSFDLPPITPVEFIVIEQAPSPMSAEPVKPTTSAKRHGPVNSDPRSKSSSQSQRQLLAGNKISQLLSDEKGSEWHVPGRKNFAYSEPRLFDFQSDQFFSEHSEWEYYRAVYEKIDSHLLFDSILAQYNHFGTVYVQFALSAKGELLEQDLRVKAEDRILKVHVMRALRKAVTRGLVAEQNNPTGRSILFQSKFDFLQDSPQINFAKQKAFGRPVFIFKRATTEKPISNDLGDHLMNGGIDYDVFAAAERWQKYNHKKMQRETGFDPFQSYKEDPDYNL